MSTVAPPPPTSRANDVSLDELPTSGVGAYLRHGGAILAIAVLLGSIIAANYVTTDYGFIPIGFGLEATAGTFFAGFALAARDAIYDLWGRLPVLGVILFGTLISYLIAAPAIATASAAAFLLAELLDYAVYVPIRLKSRLGDKRWAAAVVFSNVVGSLTDTIVFIGIAFGAAAIGPVLPGQVVGKLYATVLYLILGWALAYIVRKRRK